MTNFYGQYCGFGAGFPAGAGAVWSGSRGVCLGGYDPPYLNILDYITIASTGNATDFGDLGAPTIEIGGVSDGSRGISVGGYASGYTDVLEYVTISTTGNSTDFGDLTQATSLLAALSNGTRAVRGGGTNGVGGPNNEKDICDYWTIATTGNAVDFGDLTIAKDGVGPIGNATRGLFGGGGTNSPGTPSPSRDDIDYITVATTGNAADFGNLTVVANGQGSCSNETRGVWGGGNPSNINVINYVTVASLGDATDFGDLTVGRGDMGSGDVSNLTRGCFMAGYTPTSDVIDYVTIASTGDATDFGDLTTERYGCGAFAGT